jgi:hypothetical protein
VLPLNLSASPHAWRAPAGWLGSCATWAEWDLTHVMRTAPSLLLWLMPRPVCSGLHAFCALRNDVRLSSPAYICRTTRSACVQLADRGLAPIHTSSRGVVEVRAPQLLLL